MNLKKEDIYESKFQETQISSFSIFWTFFRIGFFTLGGGLAMVTVMRHELVFKNQWIKEEDFITEMSTATMIPGAIAVNIAYLQGRRLLGKIGSVMAILGVILPSFSIILLIACFALPYFKNPKVVAFFRGCAIAVVGQLAFSVFTFGKKLLQSWHNVFICFLALAIITITKIHPIFAILVAGGLGYFFCSNNAKIEKKKQELEENNSLHS